MSSYEDYNRVSRSYDQTRRPVGVALVKVGIARSGMPLDTVTLIDAGCGTGAYTETLLDDIPGIVALDFSAGMLAAARAKAQGQTARFVQGSILDLPIADGAADAVLNNLVLHHLPNTDSFAAQRQAFAEFARILRPGGAAVIGVCTREQLRDGFWFTRLIPQAIDACCEKTAPLDQQISMLEDAGFAVDDPAIPWDDILQADAYYDRLGPLDAAWRDGDSVWSLSPAEELKAACAQVRRMEADGTLAGRIDDHEAQRRKTGQITYLTAIRR